MAERHWTKSARVNFPPDLIFEWMSDFQEDDHGRPAYIKGSGAPAKYSKKPSKRTIVSRSGNNVKIHDQWGGKQFDMDLELAPLDRTIKMSGAWNYRAVWKAVPDSGGTKVEAEVTIRAGGLAGLLMALFMGKKKFYRQLDYDFAGHMSDLQDSLGGGN
jgi:hypothetical protein